ncbi:MAG: tyrosine-type recombinase/integrase, partial [Oscillospiraceae bacterium]
MGERINLAIWMKKYNRWQIKVRKDGVRRTFTCPTPGTKGQKECQKKADAWLDEGIINSSVKVLKLYAKWIEELKLSTSTDHWTQYNRYFDNYIKSKIGNKKVGNITEQDMQDVIFYAHKIGNKKTGLSEKTLKNIRACLMAFIKYARKNKCTTMYPEDLRIPKNAAKSTRSSLQPHDIEILFQCATTQINNHIIPEWYIYAYRFQAVTGLRPGELFGLQQNDIKNNCCVICRSINVHNEITGGKNKNALRSFILPEIALEILKNQKDMLNSEKIISPYIFCGIDGKHANPQKYYRQWIRYCNHNGISHHSPYELRHTFFSINKSIPSELIKPMGGHSKSFDTFKTYGHELNGEAQL